MAVDSVLDLFLQDELAAAIASVNTLHSVRAFSSTFYSDILFP